MTKTTINIKADMDVKEQAQQVAKNLGMPLSTVINAYLKQLIRTKEVHFSVEGKLKPSVKKRFAKLHKDVMMGKNLSPAFNSAREMDDYLDSIVK